MIRVMNNFISTSTFVFLVVLRKYLDLKKYIQLPTPVLLPGKSHGQRNVVGYSPWGHKRVGHHWVTSLSLSHEF